MQPYGLCAFTVHLLLHVAFHIVLRCCDGYGSTTRPTKMYCILLKLQLSLWMCFPQRCCLYWIIQPSVEKPTHRASRPFTLPPPALHGVGRSSSLSRRSDSLNVGGWIIELETTSSANTTKETDDGSSALWTSHHPQTTRIYLLSERPSFGLDIPQQRRL